MLEADGGVANDMAMCRVIEAALALGQVLLIEDMSQSAHDDRQSKTSNAGEQDGGLVQAMIQQIVQHRACHTKHTSTIKVTPPAAVAQAYMRSL